MANGIAVHDGDILAIPFADGRVAAAIVLHVSRHFRMAMMIGVFDQLFAAAEDISPEHLRSSFIAVPNYTGRQMARDGDWPIVGNSQALLAKATVPYLRVADSIYYKDTAVTGLSPLEESYCPIHCVMGMYYVQNWLAEHFRNRQPGQPTTFFGRLRSLLS